MTKMYSTPAKAMPPPQDRNSSDRAGLGNHRDDQRKDARHHGKGRVSRWIDVDPEEERDPQGDNDPDGGSEPVRVDGQPASARWCPRQAPRPAGRIL